MIINHKIVRNSGATLEPCIYKRGHGVLEQGLKMAHYPAVFAPILTTLNDGYIMPTMTEASVVDLPLALERLAVLWDTPASETLTALGTTDRLRHHNVQVEPFAADVPELKEALATWWQRSQLIAGKRVTVVHGDPTLENYVCDGWWLDPSIRPLPLEAELDGGKLLQSYFGYGGYTNMSTRRVIRSYIHVWGLDIDLCMYYMVTHVVRLYQVQPQAREWALDLLRNLEHDALIQELRCR